jgi:hypothetical protein
MGYFWENDPVVSDTPAAVKAGGGKAFWESDPVVQAPGSSLGATADDVVRSGVSGVAKGAIGLAGAPYDIGKLAEGFIRGGSRWLKGQTPEEQEADLRKNAFGYTLKDTLPGLGSADITKGVESVLGNKLYEPQTTPGKYAQTVGEFVPGAAAMGAGGIASRLATQAVVPGLAAEAAGQVTQGTSIEPFARAGAALGAGALGAVASAPRTAESALGKSLRGVDPATVGRAEGLINDAAQQGVRLTWDEAIQQITGGATRLGDLRRVVENSRGGGDVLKPLMAERPAQVQAAGGQAIGAIAPNAMDPVRAGVANQRGATRELAGAQTAVNAATRPDYAAAAQQRVGPQVHQALLADPLYERTIREVRGNPALNAGIDHLPDDSVAVIDMVQRRMREAAENARVPGQASTSNTAAMNLEQARTAPLTAAEMASGGPYGDYARARASQQTLRQNFLEPLNQGPLGDVAKTSDVMQQGRAVLPRTPAPGSESVVAETVSRLARQDPDAAANLIHAQIRSAFDEATQNNLAGPNQFGGAKFAAVIAGNGQQATNLETAVRALPNGDQRWGGFRRFLDVMEATGQRPQVGSMTAFNAEIQKQLKMGGVAAEGIAAAKTGGASIIKRLMDFGEQLNLGRNTEQIARLLVDPRAGQLLERMASAPPSQLPVLALRLSYMGRTGLKSAGPGYRSAPQPSEGN